MQRKKIFGIHGAGNIGLGLMAEIISRGLDQYSIVALTNNLFFSKLVSAASGRLWLQHNESEVPSTCISDLELKSRTLANILDLYCRADFVAICVTPEVMNNIAIDVAQGLITRYDTNATPLKILVLMNLPQCDTYVKNILAKHILFLTGDVIKTKCILAQVEIHPTIVDRIVSRVTREDVIKQLKQQLLALNKLQQVKLSKAAIDRIAKDEVLLLEAVKKYQLKPHLFNAEKNFRMYVSHRFLAAAQFPAMTISTHLNQLEVFKNKYMNGPHAMLAWAGAILGCRTIAEAAAHPFVAQFIKKTMRDEIKPILSAECPNITRKELEYFEFKFFKRCLASVNDTVKRVGRDPIRKLQSGGHIQGALELSRKHNLNIPTDGLVQGMALGILYAVKGCDPENKECQKIADIFEKNNRSYEALLRDSEIVSHKLTKNMVLKRILDKIDQCEKLRSYYTANQSMRNMQHQGQ